MPSAPRNELFHYCMYS